MFPYQWLQGCMLDIRNSISPNPPLRNQRGGESTHGVHTIPDHARRKGGYTLTKSKVEAANRSSGLSLRTLRP